MKKILIFLGITLIGAMAVQDTIQNFKDQKDIAITTPAQQNMRTPSNQNPGQIPRDMQTQRMRNNQSNPQWNKNPNNYSNKFDNFNRNRDRDNMRQYMDREDNLNRDYDKPDKKNIWDNFKHD